MNELTSQQSPQLFSRAQESMKGKWGEAIVASLIIGVVMIGASIIPLGGIIIGGPLYLGAAIWALRFIRGQEFNNDHLFKGFDNFANALVAYLLMILLTLAGLILLIIPGIIVGLGLSQTLFIMADDPKIGPSDALRKSWDMMKGHKGRLFVIYLAMMGLSIMCLFTLGIGYLFLIPFMRTWLAHFYQDLSGVEMPSEIDQIGEADPVVS